MHKPLKYTKGFKYQVMEPWWLKTNITIPDGVDANWISLSRDGLLIIKKGFAWDGPSGPTIDTDDSLKGSAVHDALCRLMSWDMVDKSWKNYADSLARDIWIASGMNPVRANMWRGVLRYFDFYVNQPKEILEAP